jgi:septin family protein
LDGIGKSTFINTLFDADIAGHTSYDPLKDLSIDDLSKKIPMTFEKHSYGIPSQSCSLYINLLFRNAGTWPKVGF